MIVLSNISKVFDNGKVALTAVDNVNLTIAQGQIYGIIGYSGAGKSTLIRLLNGLEKPSSGSVTINGQNISAAKGEALHWTLDDARAWHRIGVKQAIYHRGRDAQASGQQWGEEDLAKMKELSDIGLQLSITGGITRRPAAV